MKCKQPLLCSFLVFFTLIGIVAFIYNYQNNDKKNHELDSKVRVLNNKIVSLKSKKKKNTNFIQIAEDIEKNLKKKDIKISSLKILNNKIILKLEAKLSLLIEFVYYCEYYNLFSKIEQVYFQETLKKNLYQLKVILSFNEAQVKSNKIVVIFN